jgi:uncharacterized protein YbaR (Trm112 family)
MKIFEVFPEIKAIGQNILQQLCTEWLKTAVAQEFGVSDLKVVEVDGKLALYPSFCMTHNLQEKEEIYLPTERLLYYIADHGIQDNVVKTKVKSLIAVKTKKHPNVYRKFIVNLGEKKPLFLTCKTLGCGNIMQTQYEAYKSQTLTIKNGRFTCPRCKQTHSIEDGDLWYQHDD